MIVVALAWPFLTVATSLAFLSAVRAHGRRLDPRLQAGDVDTNGDILDEAGLERVDAAIGPLADNVDRADQLDLVLTDLARMRGWSAGRR